jgi:muramoyltetrapeptide carboxypeptidase
MDMKHPASLQPGDTVEIIAPASRCSDEELTDLKNLLISWQLHCIVAEDMFGQDVFCANSDSMRLQHLTRALNRSDTKAIICARGGYGSLRLIPDLMKISPPPTVKWFVGMSDITALQLFLQQHWHWPVIHGAASPTRFSPESIAQLQSILFRTTKKTIFDELVPLNAAAEKKHCITGSVTGGNLCLVQTSLGTPWQIDGRDKILFLEETNERGYRVDRMLEHVRQAHVFNQVKAILFGDFLGGQEPNGTSLVDTALARFAEHSMLPVLRIAGIGHGYINFPLPLGMPAELTCGGKGRLSILI